MLKNSSVQMIPGLIKYPAVLFFLFIAFRAQAGDSVYVRSLKCYVEIVDNNDEILVVRRNDLYGLSNSSGKLLVPIKNKAYSGAGLGHFQFGQRYVFVYDGKVTVNIVCDSLDVGDAEAIVYKKGKWGIVNYTTSFVSRIIYDSIGYLHQAEVVYRNGKCGLVNSRSTRISRVVYDSIFGEKHRAKGYKNGKCGLIRCLNDGFFYSRCMYDSMALYFEESKLTAAYLKSKIYVYSNRRLNKTPFDEIIVSEYAKWQKGTKHNDYLYVRRNDKWGAMGGDGKTVVEIKYVDTIEMRRAFLKYATFRSVR